MEYKNPNEWTSNKFIYLTKVFNRLFLAWKKFFMHYFSTLRLQSSPTNKLYLFIVTILRSLLLDDDM